MVSKFKDIKCNEGPAETVSSGEAAETAIRLSKEADAVWDDVRSASYNGHTPIDPADEPEESPGK